MHKRHEFCMFFVWLINHIFIRSRFDFEFLFCRFPCPQQWRSNFEPVFEGVREQQLQDIKEKLEKVSLNVDQAACLVDLLDETVWGSSLDELKAAMTPRADPAADNIRKQPQDYTWFLHYITPSMWKGMESFDGFHVLEKLCHHAALLGLRNPTEQSVATLLTLSFDTHGLLLDSEKWSLMQQHKDYIKKQLGKFGKCTLHLRQLPENPEELPQELRLRAFLFGPFCAAFGCGPPTGSTWQSP